MERSQGALSFDIMKQVAFIFLLCAFSCSYAQTRYQKDFAFYWNTVKDNFAYFDTQDTDWNKVKELYQPLADTITTSRSFIQLLERVNHELYNGHISLNTNLPSSGRLIPSGADLWVTYKDKQYIIAAIRPGFNAERSGLKPGMRILTFNDEAIDSAIRNFLPRSFSAYDERVYSYAANVLLAGRHNTKRKIVAVHNGIQKTYYVDSVGMNKPNYWAIIEYEVLGDNTGYIKINNSLGNNDLIAAFDHALDSMWGTKALIIDLRETPSGGNTTVARAIMSRFIEKEMPYQRHSLPGEERQSGVKRSWIEIVSPRSKVYKKPLVVLVNRWTGSMGEGIAIGFDGMKRAQVVGDKMAGLLGAIYSYTLPETNIGFSIPAEKLFHVNGTPRENFMPVLIESDNEKALALALQLLNRK
jgi:C-terminal processing protease CtpA/Prc